MTYFDKFLLVCNRELLQIYKNNLQEELEIANIQLRDRRNIILKNMEQDKSEVVKRIKQDEF